MARGCIVHSFELNLNEWNVRLWIIIHCCLFTLQCNFSTPHFQRAFLKKKKKKRQRMGTYLTSAEFPCALTFELSVCRAAAAVQRLGNTDEHRTSLFHWSVAQRCLLVAIPAAVDTPLQFLHHLSHSSWPQQIAACICLVTVAYWRQQSIIISSLPW